MIRVAMLSYWHVHAADYAKQARENPHTEIAAVWDEVSERGQQQAASLNVPYYESLDQLLARTDVDAVIVGTPTNRHRDVMVAAANAGKHIFTEKVLAVTLEEANEILRAVELNQVKLTVSLPRLNDGYTLAIQEILQAGLLGELTQARVRLSHNGATAGWLPEHFFNLEQCGGGAMIDLGCHPMYLTRLFLGMPTGASAAYGYVTGKEVEDNAVAVLQYESGALGIVEAGFVNSHSPFSIELHGKDGSLFFGTPERRLMVRSSKSEDSSGWEDRELPANAASAFEQWVGHIRNNTTAARNIRLAVDLTKLMEACNLSAKAGRPVRISELRA